MNSVSNFIDFYTKCYRADNRDLTIWDVFKVTDAYWLEAKEDELSTAFMPRIPVPYKIAETLFKKRKIHIREKNLIYGILFITGKLSGISGFVSERNICSPLIYFDADIEKENDNYYFRIDLENAHLNTPLLTEISANEDGEKLLQDFPVITGAIDNLLLGSIISWINSNSIVEETLNLVRFPKLINKADVKALFYGQEPLIAVSSATLLLIDRPKSSRGILHELKTLTSNGDYSAPLRALFSPDTTIVSGERIEPDNIPGLLSFSQINALEIASQHVLGLVSGPPGTGKSYTIAAIALDRLLQGEHVLIVSETDQSIDVINDILANTFNAKNVVLRAGTKTFLKNLKKLLDNWLKFGVEPVDSADVKKLCKALKASKQMIVKQEKQYVKRAIQSIRWGHALSRINKKPGKSFVSKIKNAYIAWRIGHSKIHWKQLDELQLLLNKRSQNAAEYLKLHVNHCIARLLTQHRSHLSKFNMAIRARSSQKQLLLHDEIDYKLILKAFPVWLASLDILHHVLPLKKELFDLVIIDEATQCNIASVIPALQRAKRVIIVGDSKQLKHVSFLPYKKENELFLNSGLDTNEYEGHSYRKNSILDLVSNAITTQNAVVMLDEHYRSHPDLISFSNQRFYESRLKIMRHRPGEHMTGNVIVINTQGKRDTKGVNKTEAQAVINHVIEMIAQFKDKLSKPSLGVLSPFREQVNFLQKQLLKCVSTDDIENHAIRVATPYGFQGDEKDYMLLSLSIDDESRRAAAYLNREDMFNVAITRAKQAIYLFVSAEHRLLPSANLFRQYMESIELFKEISTPVNEIFDGFQIEVCETLNTYGISTRKAYPVAGRNVDILCSIGSKSIAIDLIGFPGEYAESLELTTYYLLSRAGLEIFPLSFGLWTMDKKLCINEIRKRFM